MSASELVNTINQSVDDLNLVVARRYIEENKEMLNENKHLLRRNARELLDFVNTKSENLLDRKEMNIIHSINAYASRFDLRGLKLSIKNNAELFMRPDIKEYLSSDAQIILEGMNAIH